MNKKLYSAGIDGGGSKTACLVAFGSSIVGRAFLPGCNPNDIGFEKSLEIIIASVKEACREAKTDPSELRGIFAGISGLVSGGYCEHMQTRLGYSFPGARVEASHDGMNLIYASFPDSDGAVVICGTGSACFVKTNQNITRIGGYGIFDLGGGGYEIGRQAIGRAFEAFDGRAEHSLVCDLIEQKAGGSLGDRLGDLISGGRKHIASFAECVYEACEKGDMAAAKIIESNMAHTAGLINRASDSFDGDFEVKIAGSVGKNNISLKYLKREIVPQAHLSVLDIEPVYGALARAKSLAQKAHS